MATSGSRRRAGSPSAPEDQFFEILGQRYPLPFLEDIGGTKERILMTATLLFARRGFADVSIRDIARANGVKAPSLYNHFKGKDDLWAATLEHVKNLYFLYFERLALALEAAATFRETLAILFHEPKRLANVFTCYGFTLVMLEQVRDESAARIFDSFMERGLQVIGSKFEDLAARGDFVPGFDVRMAAVLLMNNTFMGLLSKVQELQGRRPLCRAEEMFAGMERFILKAGSANPADEPASALELNRARRG